MKILLVNKFTRITGGADRVCLELGEALVDAGHEVAFLSTAPGRDVPGIAIPATVTNESREDLRGRSRLRPAAAAIWSRPAYSATQQLLREFEPDVVHAHKLYPQLSVAPLVAARRHGVPVIQTILDYEFISASHANPEGSAIDRDESRFGYRLLNTALFQVKRRRHIPAVARWVAISEAVRKTYERHGITATTVPLFTETPPGPIPGRDTRSGVIYIGRLTAEKGVPDLLEAARAMPEIPIKILGHGPLEEMVSEQAAELPNLTYLGQASERVKPELQASLGCVVPSVWEEPAGLVSLEAMAAGTPVIATDVGGIPEYVGAAGCGFIVPPGAASLVDGCKRLIAASDEQWLEFSRNGRAAVEARHTPAAYVEGMMEIYKAAVDRSHPQG